MTGIVSHYKGPGACRFHLLAIGMKCVLPFTLRHYEAWGSPVHASAASCGPIFDILQARVLQSEEVMWHWTYGCNLTAYASKE